jgi:DNA-binding FadR family transcriptional regulator
MMKGHPAIARAVVDGDTSLATRRMTQHLKDLSARSK